MSDFESEVETEESADAVSFAGKEGRVAQREEDPVETERVKSKKQHT